MANVKVDFMHFFLPKKEKKNRRINWDKFLNGLFLVLGLAG